MRTRFTGVEKMDAGLSISMRLMNRKPLQNVPFYGLILLMRHGLISYRITDQAAMRAKHLNLSLVLLLMMMFIPHLPFILREY